MSNGDDVLDNWEEFDEAGVLQSTLQNLKGLATTQQPSTSRPTDQFISPALPSLKQLPSSSYTSFDASCTPTSLPQRQQPMKLLQRSSLDSTVVVPSAALSRPSPTTNSNFVKSPLDDMAATFQPVMMVLHKPDDEYQSANYTQPIVNQTVKILRRPTQSSEPRNNGMRPKQPIKTLKQREQEYAEARLRILGSAKNPEDDEQRAANAAAASAAGTAVTAINPTTTSTTAFPTNLPNNVVVAPTTKMNSPKTQLGGVPNMYNNHYQYQQQQQQQQQLQLQHTQQQHQPPNPYQQQHFHPNYQQQQQQQQQHQQQQQNFFYNQQPQSPAYNNSTNNNRTFSSMPLLGHGPMGAIGQPAQYQQQAATPQTMTAQAALQQQMKMQQQQYLHNSSQQQQHLKQQPQQQQQTWSPVVGGSVSSSNLRQQPNDSILRLPRGPDGTVGFQTRR